MPPTTRATTRAQQTNAERDPSADQAGTLLTPPSAHTEHGTLPQLTENDELEHQAESIGNLLLTSDLPRTYSQGIGHFAIDATRVMENLNLDTTAPLMHSRGITLPLPSTMTPELIRTNRSVTHPQPRTATTNAPHASSLTHRHVTYHPVHTNVPVTNAHHHMQMTPTTRFEALVYILKIMNVPEERAKLWAMNALCDNDLPVSTEGARRTQQAPATTHPVPSLRRGQRRAGCQH
jgi:hypothetical protein